LKATLFDQQRIRYALTSAHRHLEKSLTGSVPCVVAPLDQGMSEGHSILGKIGGW